MKTPVTLALALAAAITLSTPETSRAQLAITEVMSSASTNLGPSLVTQNSDYWELTNFGTNAIDLTGFRFDDSDNNLAAADSTPFDGVIVGPNESILFVQNNVNTNDVSVREWWGTNLASGVRVVFYSGNGLSSGGDGIRLWGPSAQNESEVVDSVDFGEAVRGSSFTYDPMTGEFGALSTNGVSGAFNAATADDIGSPGRTTGPTPLSITQQPADVIVNPGDAASLTVAVRGRPRGMLQWHFETAPIAGATNSTLIITNTQSNTAGTYYVTIDNGVTRTQSLSARVVLATEATAPVFTDTPNDLSLYAGQSFTFTASASGAPQPTVQWQRNGTDIQGATTPSLSLNAVSEQDSGLYAVIARNAVGAVTNEFRVTVTAKPQLIVTEVMSSASTNATGHNDWWELTNLGNFEVNLRGLRFDDNSETLGAADTFTNEFSIAPGESIIFVENMTPEEFRDWWGTEYLLPELQILTYRGNGLSSVGDAVNLWNAAAAEDSDKLASVVFSTASAGITFGFNPDSGQFGDLTVEGAHGAFIAASGGDVGSPGYLRNSQRVILPRLREIVVQAGNVRLTWSSQPGTTYQLQVKSDLRDQEWTTAREVGATGATTTVEETAAPAPTQRFYRVVAAPTS